MTLLIHLYPRIPRHLYSASLANLGLADQKLTLYKPIA
jgi:hypothetical protein